MQFVFRVEQVTTFNCASADILKTVVKADTVLQGDMLYGKDSANSYGEEKTCILPYCGS